MKNSLLPELLDFYVTGCNILVSAGIQFAESYCTHKEVEETSNDSTTHS
jgi:hypothetical protein